MRIDYTAHACALCGAPVSVEYTWDEPYYERSCMHHGAAVKAFPLTLLLNPAEWEATLGAWRLEAWHEAWADCERKRARGPRPYLNPDLTYTPEARYARWLRIKQHRDMVRLFNWNLKTLYVGRLREDLNRQAVLLGEA